jgi:hypothetical protein
VETLFRKLVLPIATVAMAVVPFAAHAGTVTMSVVYYTIAENDQDMNHLAGGVFTNEVQNSLGTDGLPLLNTAAFGCASGCFTNTPLPADVTAGGEITWWSPTLNSHVTQTGTGTITLPYSNGSFYPPNGTGANDSSGFQSAVFSTTLNVPTQESISFTIGADDVAFAYLDGSIVCDLGGVHANSPGVCTSGVLNPGTHTVKLFFADLENVGSALTFNVTTADVTGTGTPEPGTMALLGTALVGLGAIARCRARPRNRE